MACKKGASRPQYTVIRDTREQDGWTFPCSALCAGMVEGTLKTGDYTLHGYEDLLAIERKGSVAEFAGNVVEARFARELERLEAFRYPFVVLEFELQAILSFPVNSGIPRSRWASLRITPQFLLKKLTEFQACFRAQFVFAGKHGMAYASSLFKRITEAEKRCPEHPTQND